MVLLLILHWVNREQIYPYPEVTPNKFLRMFEKRENFASLIMVTSVQWVNMERILGWTTDPIGVT